MAYNLGTAYIRIAPNLTGVQNKLQKELNDAGKKSGESSGSSFSQAFSTKAVAVGTFLGNMATKAFSAVGSAISNSLDAAINRSDELKYRFGSAMANLGIDSDKAEAAIARVSDALTGLPTTTDDAASSIKKLTAVTNDVDKASDIFLAFNNAVVAGAAPAERQSEAILQMGEAYARGKPDMKEWRIWMETMPGQMNQVAEAMGYGSNGASDLGDALRKGDVSMDEFLGTFVELNNVASEEDGFINFADQAQNASGGLAVSMTRMQTAVTRGVTSILDTLQGGKNDIGAAYMGIGAIAEGLLSGNSDKIDQGTDQLIEAMEKIGPRIQELIAKLAPKLATFLAQNFPRIINTLVTQATNIIVTLVQYLPEIISGLMSALPGIIDNLVKTLFNPDTLNKLLNAAIDIVIALVEYLPDIILALVEALPYIINSIVDVLTDVENMKKIATVGPKIIIALAKALIGAIGELLIACGEIMGKLLSKLGEMPGKMIETGKAWIEGLWQGIKDAKDWLISKLTELCNNAIDAVKSFFGIASPSKLMAEQGKYIAQGFGLGIEKNADYATDAMEKMADDVLAEAGILDAQFQTPLNSTFGTQSNRIERNVNQYNTFNQVANDLDMKEISRSLGFAVETAI